MLEDKDQGIWRLRWFTPDGSEVDLCGHATLAAAHVAFTKIPSMAGVHKVTFHTRRSGPLTITSEPGASEFPKYRMVFPVETTSEIPETVQASAREIFSTEAKVCRGGPDLLVVVGSWETVRACSPDSKLLEVLLRQNGLRGAILTAAISPDEGPPPGESELSFVSRFFAPNLGIEEDPCTGSAHCCLGLYWWLQGGGSLTEARRPGQRVAAFKAMQMSHRKGYLDVELHADETGKLVTHLIGNAVDYMEATIILEE